MDLTPEYQKIRQAGLMAMVLGWLQIALVPLILAATHTLGPVNAVFILLQAGCLIWFGSRIKALSQGPDHDLPAIVSAIKRLLTSVIVLMTAVLLTGGRAGLLMLVLVVFLVKAWQATKIIQQAQSPS